MWTVFAHREFCTNPVPQVPPYKKDFKLKFMVVSTNCVSYEVQKSFFKYSNFFFIISFDMHLINDQVWDLSEFHKDNEFQEINVETYEFAFVCIRLVWNELQYKFVLVFFVVGYINNIKIQNFIIQFLSGRRGAACL